MDARNRHNGQRQTNERTDGWTVFVRPLVRSKLHPRDERTDSLSVRLLDGVDTICATLHVVSVAT